MASQVLTLFTTPVTYLWLPRFAGWLRRGLRRLTGRGPGGGRVGTVGERH
jgi:hypothetical protein